MPSGGDIVNSHLVPSGGDIINSHQVPSSGDIIDSHQELHLQELHYFIMDYHVLPHRQAAPVYILQKCCVLYQTVCSLCYTKGTKICAFLSDSWELQAIQFW